MNEWVNECLVLQGLEQESSFKGTYTYYIGLLEYPNATATSNAGYFSAVF